MNAQGGQVPTNFVGSWVGRIGILDIHIANFKPVNAFADPSLSELLEEPPVQEYLREIGFVDPMRLDENGRLAHPFDIVSSLYNAPTDGHIVWSLRFSLHKNLIH